MAKYIPPYDSKEITSSPHRLVSTNTCKFYTILLFWACISATLIIPFRFVLCANHMEVKGFLGRFLRRKLVEAEIRTGIRNNDLNRVVDWIPKVWAHLNKALESHSSADVTIGGFNFMDSFGGFFLF